MPEPGGILNVNWRLWDFTSVHGRNLIAGWASNLSSRDRAFLDEKLDFLCGIEFEVAIRLKAVAGPLRGNNHIYKLRAHGQVQMRPMLCRGPRDNNSELTLLEGAIERNGRLHPSDAPDRASRNREELKQDFRRRIPHARFAL